jgi:predicted GNAT family acetyltransferase
MSSTASSDRVVTRNDDRQRYELHVDDELISIADFSEIPGAIVVPHVETAPQHRGNGFSSTLMAGVIDDLTQRSLKIVPHCPFARSYVRGLPNADELIAS